MPGFSSLLVGVCLLSPAQAKVLIDIDLSAQTMHVGRIGRLLRHWPISSARDGYVTPDGTFSCAEPAIDPLFEEILSFADAAFDLF